MAVEELLRRGNIEGSEPARKEISLILTVTNLLNVCITCILAILERAR